jgi:RNA polymerase sigma-70 factor (ECF subfamily)
MDPTTIQSDFIERFCRAHGGQLENYLTQMVGSPELARELAQDSFERIQKTYRPEQVLYPRALLFKVATNFALMHLRRRRLECALIAEVQGIEQAEEEADCRIGPDRDANMAQLGEHLARAIKALRPSLRGVFVMAHMEGRPRKEIAMALGLSEKRLDKRMTAALRKCREHLLSNGIDLTDLLGLATMLPFACMIGVN